MTHTDTLPRGANSLRTQPDDRGHFGQFGGRYVAETLMPLVLSLESEYKKAKNDSSFQAEFDDLLEHYVGRPSPLYFAERLTEEVGGAQIWFKRDELNHTGAHKINNCIGQILLARRMGKTRIIAETGAGQHGVATATVAARFGLPCIIYMGARDTLVLLEVEDNGCGMSQETLSKIFDPFFSTKFTGRGLGLAAVLGIVRGHDGGLRVESELSVGTTFELVFPGEDATALETAAPEIVQEAAMQRQLILLIDDEEPVRDAVTDILEMEGLSVLTVSDGQHGLELYRARQTEIDLIILDLSMPGLTGEETFRELRQINPQVRIMLSSGYSHDEVTSRFAGQREVAFIQKPYDATQLVTEVKRQLARPRG